MAESARQTRTEIVAARGLELAKEFLTYRYPEARLYGIPEFAPRALDNALQQTIGDLLVIPADRDLWSVEVKTEETTPSGCLFVEYFADRSCHPPERGWFLALNTDQLIYCFLDWRGGPILLVFAFRPFRRWFLGAERGPGAVQRYKERSHVKRDDGRRETTGFLVPLRDLVMERCCNAYRPIPTAPGWRLVPAAELPDGTTQAPLVLRPR